MEARMGRDWRSQARRAARQAGPKRQRRDLPAGLGPLMLIAHVLYGAVHDRDTPPDA